MKKILQTLYVMGTYFAVDALLRILSRWLGYYSIYQPAPSLFSLCWIIIIMVFLSLFSKKNGQKIYAISFFVLALYSVVQYIYYRVFNRFLFLSDLTLAAEGADFFGYVKNVADWNVLMQATILTILGFTGILLFPDFKKPVRKTLFTRLVAVIVSCIGLTVIPSLFNYNINEIVNAKYEYETFTSSGFDMEIAGYYQYLARDTWMTFLKPKENTDEMIEKINNFFEEQQSQHSSNEMSGFLNGKNVIIVQLETIDDWMINETDTPCIKRMMDEGINFTEMYTPCFGTGWTFGTEFAFNTGVYQGATVYSGERLARNHYPLSIAHLAQMKGYLCNSLHENFGSYYSRSGMHKVFGYTYYCSQDYLEPDEYAMDDTTLISNDKCWSILTSERPFFSFLITMSPHLPYSNDDETVRYACGYYDEVCESNNETDNLQLKARLTDEMFSLMLERLKEDDLLDNTVIIAYGDHYSYGLTDKATLQNLSENAGSDVLEKTPAFIWYKGCVPRKVTKTCQTVDWLPTLVNMLDLDVYNSFLGRDIFDPEYKGYAVFPDNTWIYDDCYVKNGRVIRGNLSEAEIRKYSDLYLDYTTVNQDILMSDYYAYIESHD